MTVSRSPFGNTSTMAAGNKRSFRHKPMVTGEKTRDEAAIDTSSIANLLEHRLQKSAASPVSRIGTVSRRSKERFIPRHRNLAAKYVLTVAYKTAAVPRTKAGSGTGETPVPPPIVTDTYA